jgi:hypothetical protein
MYDHGYADRNIDRSRGFTPDDTPRAIGLFSRAISKMSYE